jgi:SAM-dependent MidA family methyltransferase
MASSRPRRGGALAEVVREEIRARGRITFSRYMELALYHPLYGYYSSGAASIGPEGDYYTSTDVSPFFGATVGRQLHEMWTVLGEPGEFTVVEYGAGKGLLAADVLGWAGAAHPSFYRSLRYRILELSPGLRAVQREKLRRLPVEWVEESDLGPGSVEGCFLSNEVADALPFHRVRGMGGGLAELWVSESGGALREEPGELSTPELREYLELAGVSLPEGQTAEVNLQAPAWMRGQVERLRAGWVLTIDYGNTAGELYGGRYPEGTLACYYRHTRNTEPFERIGEQDITAHVDFTARARGARAP